MYWNYFRLRRPLIAATRQTKDFQQRLLQSILQKNAHTEFGRLFNFSSIKSMTDYRSVVPVQSYDSLEPFIQKQINGENALTYDAPVFYARTSGTTGKHKDIPLTTNGLQQVEHAQKQLAYSLWKDTGFLKGSILGFASAAKEGKLDNGCNYGSVSGSSYKSVSPLVAKKFVVPAKVFSFKDVNAKYQAYALSVLASDTLSGIVAANPSSILKLVRYIEKNTHELLHILNGSKSPWLLPETAIVLSSIRRCAAKQRLLNLNEYYTQNKNLLPAEVFPALSTIATWTGGSCGIALKQLRRYLPRVRVVEYGYGASEFMGTVNIDAINKQCVPQLTHHVYEFATRDNWESGKPIFCGAHELDIGTEYYVFITTQSGLYRYNINDIVRVDGALHNCATFAFLQKGQGVTNITGEKLSEHQVIEMMSDIIDQHELHTGGYLVLANETKSRYDIYLEFDQPDLLAGLPVEIDKKLCELNIEYEEKRTSGRLQAASLQCLSIGACETIKDWCVAGGVREAQYKPTVLAYSRDWTDKLSRLLLENAS